MIKFPTLIPEKFSVKKKRIAENKSTSRSGNKRVCGDLWALIFDISEL